VRWTGPLDAVGLLTALPVPGGAASSTRGVLPWAPLVGLVLGGVATGIGLLGARTVSPLTGAVLVVTVLALLTRGLHLDGLADTADGLGPLRDRDRALAVMRQGDVGPFGVAAIVLALLLQVSSAAVLLASDGGWVAVWAAIAAARLALTRTGLPGTPVAAGSRLGQAVAGSVRPAVATAWGVVLLVAAAAATVAASDADPGRVAGVVGSVLAGLLAAEVVLRRAASRLGGVTGDVMGAMAEVSTAVALLVAAAVVS
jgi:adenosylcobinamide-GDP ribazoletransferase